MDGERICVPEKPRSWLSDFAPEISKTQDGLLIIKGDPFLTGYQSLLMVALTAIIGLGVPWLFNFSGSTADGRVAFGLWCLLVCSGPLLLISFYPSILIVNSRAKNLKIKSGLWKVHTVIIPFDQILAIRRQNVYYWGRYGKIHTDLAYLDLKAYLPSLSPTDVLWGAPVLSVDAVSMDVFLEFCRQQQIKIL